MPVCLISQQRWARAYRDDVHYAAVDTNNGTEAMNRILKYSFMPKRKSFTLSALVTQLTERFLPDLHRNYVMQNLKSSEMYRSYNNFVPEYLRGRPRSVILHCLDRKSHGNKYDKDDIIPTEKPGAFKVMKRGNSKHTVDVLTPSCTCKDWVRWHIPCKHFFAVFGTQTEWGWAALPKSYTESPYHSASRWNCYCRILSPSGRGTTAFIWFRWSRLSSILWAC